jgi:hypothetical protein
MKRRKTASRSRRSRSTRRPKTARKKAAPRRARKTRPRKTALARKTAASKSRKPKRAARRKPAPRQKTASVHRRTPQRSGLGPSANRPRARLQESWHRGLGAEAAGQSGDLEEIPRAEDVDSESVEELLEEGQSFEAGIVSGVEKADAGDGEVHTHEVPEDDVPEEYRDRD